ncbi:hypothetical protein Ddye_029414 [Dipteronia dyeriana]|uniref:Reverse transcriptase n=1 Tax=Dipteronia dyeriana TaxID=168575 RepID=A0AAD9WLG2_9ROSI|nr:hypothetical protein Ddye_029414 [Dipteronia dyeriana]
MHTLKRQKNGWKGALVLKLDVSKEYDRVEWSLLSGMMAERSGDLVGFKCNKLGPKISHLFFVDDIMIFTRASVRDCHAIKNVYNVYSKASGQRVNFQKSAMCVSRRVSKRMVVALAMIIGVLLVDGNSSNSYLWRSFLWGQEIVLVGSQWRIGDGTSVQSLKLANGGWNEVLIRESFFPEETSLILSIPFSFRPTPDKLVWHFDKFGSYSVRSDYHLAMSLFPNPSSSGISEAESWWKYLWQMHVPAKVKLLIWRACHDWVPTLLNLAKRGVNVAHLCQSNLSTRTISNSSESSWQPPEDGLVKVNTDVAIDKVCGIIIRDNFGEVLASSAHQFFAQYPPTMAEAAVVLRGLYFVRDLGLLPCMVKTDAQMVVKTIEADKVPLSDLGLIIGDIIMFLGDYSGCSVVFTPRKNNTAAYGLAKIGLSISCDLFWMEEVPPSVVPFVKGDYPGRV